MVRTGRLLTYSSQDINSELIGWHTFSTWHLMYRLKYTKRFSISIASCIEASTSPSYQGGTPNWLPHSVLTREGNVCEFAQWHAETNSGSEGRFTKSNVLPVIKNLGSTWFPQILCSSSGNSHKWPTANYFFFNRKNSDGFLTIFTEHYLNAQFLSVGFSKRVGKQKGIYCLCGSFSHR